MAFVGGRVPERWEHYRAVCKPAAVRGEACLIVPFKVPLNREQFEPSTHALQKRSRNILISGALVDADGVVVDIGEADFNWFDDNVKRNVESILMLQAADPEASRLGSIINLCLTSRYYDAQVLRNQGVRVFHAPAPGGGTLPTFDEVLFMVRLFDSLAMSTGGRAVGIHCTHGLNRTGFYCAAYIAVKEGVSVEEAFDRAQRARGHMMYRREHCTAGEMQMTCVIH